MNLLSGSEAQRDLAMTKDRVMVKADGVPTYTLPDIAYHKEQGSIVNLILCRQCAGMLIIMRKYQDCKIWSSKLLEHESRSGNPCNL